MKVSSEHGGRRMMRGGGCRSTLEVEATSPAWMADLEEEATSPKVEMAEEHNEVEGGALSGVRCCSSTTTAPSSSFTTSDTGLPACGRGSPPPS